MSKAEIIPYKQWAHTSGVTASITGAAPHGDGWSVETAGFTIAWPDGTRGCGKPPFATEAD
jgi:hypothetical protein